MSSRRNLRVYFLRLESRISTIRDCSRGWTLIHITSYEYDAHLRLTDTVYLDGERVRLEYNSRGLPGAL